MKQLGGFIALVSVVGAGMIVLSAQLPDSSVARCIATGLTTAMVLLGSVVAWAIYKRQGGK